MIELVADPAFAALFAPDALVEAPISAVVGDRVITGQIDRLLVGEREVIALDYKSGRAPPENESTVPEAYRVQMESYRAALAAVFPDRRITCGLLFVDVPRLIWLQPPDANARAFPSHTETLWPRSRQPACGRRLRSRVDARGRAMAPQDGGPRSQPVASPSKTDSLYPQPAKRCSGRPRTPRPETARIPPP